MQDWDRLVLILIGAGVAAHTGYAGWRLWRRQNRGGALGAFFLAAVSVLAPILLSAFGG